MKILNGVLKEELDRLNQLKKNYEKQIAKLPKGSLIRKNIKGNIYYYFNYRQEKKKIFKYIGKLPGKELENLLDKIEERRKREKLNKQVKKDIKKLEKMIKNFFRKYLHINKTLLLLYPSQKKCRRPERTPAPLLMIIQI